MGTVSAVPEEYDGSEPVPANAQRGKPGQDHAMSNDRVLKAMRLKRLGASWEAIAQEMGYADGSGPRNLVMRYLELNTAESAAQLRAIENQRLDVAVQALLSVITDHTKTPEQRIRAADALTRNSARRARLNGLDAPVQVAVGAGSLAELDDALALLEAVVTGEVIESHDEPADPEPRPEPDAGLRPGDAGPGGGPGQGAGSTGDH